MPRSESVKVWGIWVPMEKALVLNTMRVTRRAAIKDYTKFYSGKRRPKFAWAQLYRWGWRCLPVVVSFNKP